MSAAASSGAPVAGDFNELMPRIEQHLKLIDAMAALNPAFVAKMRLAMEGARNSRDAANAQHGAISEALKDAFSGEVERAAVTNWFVFIAMGQGYYQAIRLLKEFAASGGDPFSVPRLPPPAPQLPAAGMPGLRIGPWKSPARARALKAVVSLGNPHGAGRVFKAALEPYVQTSRLLSAATQRMSEQMRTIGAAMADPAIQVTLEGADDSLLEVDVAAADADHHGVTMSVTLAAEWRTAIENLLKRKHVKSGSLQYWRATLERIGIPEELLEI